MKYISQKQFYPIYADANGETLDFYYSRFYKSWHKRYVKDGQSISVKIFNKGSKFDEDFKAAERRIAAEAQRRNMKCIGTVIR